MFFAHEKLLAYRPTVYKTGVHTNFVDIDLFYPLLILHAKNVKLQWKFAKFLSNQFVLQLPFFFVITYNFAFLRSYSRYMVSNRYNITILVEKFWSAKGQLISKCPFVVFKSPKNPSKKFPGFLPYPLKRGQINKVV